MVIAVLNDMDVLLVKKGNDIVLNLEYRENYYIRFNIMAETFEVFASNKDEVDFHKYLGLLTEYYYNNIEMLKEKCKEIAV